MTFNQIKMAVYSTVVTNFYGFKLTKFKDSKDKKSLRIDYANRLLNKLNIKIKVINEEKLPQDGQYLLISNHRSIIDPLIVEIATQNSLIFGYWIAKKELYDSLFFGKFTRNAGTILLDREASQMSGFFKDIKSCVKEGNSVFIFPEGTRNKTDAELTEFKEGSQIIAIKNRLPILPVFIRSKADAILKSAINDSTEQRIIELEIGDIIDYKDKTMPLEEAYRKQFNITN
ncbi:MAG: glycerol acyltransferase [Sulfurimonas sp. RIFCSPHIGHO2_12_FULL_36_9]|uniref:lysophospholipid acyltransferase family protein n=1 Tax=Sulfurimonas sp. RIFCSPLOWO2_12_36_12 TaxID=1802253 RepID=UPI0008B8E8FB|nr:lysophospholipid acyltransferase family protein [Sulfurimonas sp. RIFCSPLOWO2_12_36_12]OHD97138.1 MAG: glycerol acyltransferase [Sulfurimonas sp. RIFCSPLOWO2_02_FULL_36_28]OHD97375.1 MAG: glycerol acyltransferase [Sulfurimonas sp. RIFCSPHIGHO2_12_FULL_36_9]OHE01709.1 MAG: glycerol acyltransferase [Sulfurimonas sp. RIFCSPLOWO2_12_36_12]OHE08009.1 MAG: glycerol acyltransferase [Sulfurimonas sp. RIFCSPLOWO2_12_FULL_36_74]